LFEITEEVKFPCGISFSTNGHEKKAIKFSDEVKTVPAVQTFIRLHQEYNL